MAEIIEFEKRMISSARDLDVFKKAYSASLEIHKFSVNFPKIEQYALADQLRRSSKSICTNLAEGFGRQKESKPEFARFLNIAIGSSHETEVWLLYAKDLGYINGVCYDNLCSEYSAIIKMLTKLKNNL